MSPDGSEKVIEGHTGYGPVYALAGTFGMFFMGQFLGYLLFLVLGSAFNTISAIVNSGLAHLSLGNVLALMSENFSRLFELSTSASSQLGARDTFLQIICMQVVTLAMLYWLLHRRRVGTAYIGLIKPKIRDIGYVLSGAAVYMGAYIGIVTVLANLVQSLDLEQKQDIGFSADTAGPGLVFIFISLVILPPLVEEIIARGFLYTGLRNAMKFLPAAIITSIIFGLAHLPGGEGGSTIWIAFIDTFILSMVLVYLREKTGSLWAPIGLHGLKNLIAFLALFVFKIS